MRVMRVAAMGVLVLAHLACTPSGEALSEPSIVYLVRHAERADDGTADPPLSEAGLERAVQLAHVLTDANLTAVYSTDLARTRQTAGPVAQRFGLEVAHYDPRELEQFAAELSSISGGRILVTGHSNTTPALAELLGGDPVSPIDEAEYDRLYMVILYPPRAPTSVLLNFGQPFPEH